MWLRIRVLFLLVTMVFLFSGICFSIQDSEGNYYISEKYPDGTYDGNIKEWAVKINYLALIKTDGTVVDVMTSPVSLDLLTANKGSIAGHFKTGASLPAGNYKQVRITQGAPSYMRGWIAGPWASPFRYTKDSDPNFGETTDEGDAESLAETIEVHETCTDDVPENPTGYVTVEEGKSYELRIFWYAVGLESDKGVGLVFDMGTNEFREGMLCEQYILHCNTDDTDQYFTGS